jgi:alanine racemase
MSPRSYVEIDLGALRRNFRKMRARLGPAVRIYGVCKGDAYGTGIERVAPVLIAEGADGIAVGDPHEAARVRALDPKLPVLLYGSTDPSQAAAVAALGVTVTVFDLPGLHAFAALGRPVEVSVKLDCGFGRLGFVPEAWSDVFGLLRRMRHIRLRGLYTHLASVEEPSAVERQLGLFETAVNLAEQAGFRELELMVASSRVAIGYPERLFNAVNPGRLLYGLLDPPWDALFPVEPVVAAVKSRVIQVKMVQPGMCLGYGGVELSEPIRAAVLPIGFVAGLPRVLHRAAVLVRGRRAPTVGLASMEHLLVDASGIAGIAVGDEAVLLGKQSGDQITPHQLAAMTGLEPLEILTRMARSLPRVYLEADL